jgi:Dimethyladenosine transferase (rRNA methylation)
MDLRLTFNEDVVNYDKYRPTYTNDLFTDIIEYSGVDNTKKALEIGIGTGQATLPILKTGCALTAIELGENLAEYSKNKFKSFDNFSVINTDFESYPAPTNELDLIYSATAFHWLPEDTGFTKVYNMLKYGGVIALFWNHPYVDIESQIHVEIQKAHDKYRPLSDKAKLKEFDENACQKYVDLLNKYGFVNIKSKLYRRTRVLNTEDYISLYNTYSDHRAMEAGAKLGLESEIRDVINKFGGKIEIRDTMDLYLGMKP